MTSQGSAVLRVVLYFESNSGREFAWQMCYIVLQTLRLVEITYNNLQLDGSTRTEVTCFDGDTFELMRQTVRRGVLGERMTGDGWKPVFNWQNLWVVNTLKTFSA